jgi:hypothetical protein
MRGLRAGREVGAAAERLARARDDEDADRGVLRHLVEEARELRPSVRRDGVPPVLAVERQRRDAGLAALQMHLAHEPSSARRSAR